MRIHWKALCILGLIFWSSMCAIEQIFGNVVNRQEFETVLDFDGGDEKFLQEFPWETVLVWTALAFTSSIGLCFFLKIIRLALGKFERMDPSTRQISNSMQTSNNFELIQTSSKSKIPIPVLNLSFCDKSKADLSQIDFTNTFIPATANILEAVKDFPVTIESSEENVDSRRLPDLTNWREYSALTRKLEQISREKKDLALQLSQSQKENKQTKLQLEDILNDRSALIRRLEIATREIKLNTNTKQMTLEKLEEAVTYSNQMKNKIMKLTEEKDVLEQKLKLLEEEYKFLQLQTCILQKQDESVQKLKEIKDSITEMESNSEQGIELSQSEKDIEMIQTKLLDLEMSLDKMRMTSSASFESQVDDTADRGRESVDTLDNDKLILEIEEDDVQEEQDEHDEQENPDEQDEEHVEDSDEKIDEATECEAIGVEFKESSEETSSSATEEEETPSVILSALSEKQLFGDACKGGMVSQSPAFQKFLLSVLDQNQQNKSILTS